MWIRPGRARSQSSRSKPTVKFGGGKLMMWDCIAAKGVGHACRVDGILDKHLYK